MSARAALAIMAALGAACSAWSQPAVDQARSARLAGRVDQSEQTLAAFLRTNPNHPRALYNMGLVYEARAARAPPGPARTQHYRKGIAYLEKAIAVQGKRPVEDPTIYNSLGVMYVSVSDVGNADRCFKLGFENEARLNSASKAKLYSNAGYLAAIRGDTALSVNYLKRATTLGSGTAAANLQRLKKAGIAN